MKSSNRQFIEHPRLGRLPADWSVDKFCEITKSVRDSVDVVADRAYREIGIRSHGKGIFHKEPVHGAALGDKRVFWVKPKCLTFNIVFAWEGAVASTSAAETGMIGSHRFPLHEPCAGIADVEFLRIFFQTQLGIRLLGDASPGGAGRNRTLNQKLLAETPVPLPPFLEQRKIAAILSSVDETIERTEGVIEQLQVVKAAMMRELLSGGLPGRHARFKMTEVGKIPTSWQCISLGQVLEGIDSGWSPQCESVPAGSDEWGVLKISSVTWGDFIGSENKRLPLHLQPRPEIEVHAGDVIVSRANTPDLVGRAVLVRGTRPKLMLSDKLLRLRVVKNAIDARFLNLVLALPHSREFIKAGATGTSLSMKNISQSKLRELPLALPALEEQAAISDAIEALSLSEQREEGNLTALRTLKSALMSVLLRGELRVTSGERAA